MHREFLPNVSFLRVTQVDDQMKLLQHSWSDMLVLDHIHQHMHNNLANEIMLHNGQKFDLLALGLLGVTTMADCFAQVIDRLQELKFDVGDYICLKFLLLLNPGKSSFILVLQRWYGGFDCYTLKRNVIVY